uniref:Uncharacterized protein n=1 Tax=Minutocellus polymorphus TaxID=265543 RepID=A0A7S0AFF1_9STRA|mmetsp:Transcript_12639/g.21060  ORF Transcript_12639/g.21060 Transcript_12639/m.21060 type:complete len:201 (+) Transcript_12639:33-635(+)
MMMSSRRCSCLQRQLVRHLPSLFVLSIIWTTCCSVSCQVDAFVIDFFGKQNHKSRGGRCRQIRVQQPGRDYCSIRGRNPILLLLANENERSDETDNATEDEKMLSELVRVKLEADHRRRFLKSRPRKLGYEEARTWVQRNLGVDTEDEFNDLVENGNLRTPYIPKRPEEYYSHSNEWISWDHFLKDDLRYGVKPASGAFD